MNDKAMLGVGVGLVLAAGAFYGLDLKPSPATQPEAQPAALSETAVPGSEVSPEPLSTGPAADAVNDFTARLYREAAKRSGNLILSPFSAHAALSLTRPGAGGVTAGELAAALGPVEGARELAVSLNRETEGSRILTANAVWLQDGLRLQPDYAKALGQSARPADFKGAPEKAAAAINAWASEKTAGNITKIVSPDSLKPLRLLLANAVYFKGKWEKVFSKSKTAPGPFWNGSQEKHVPKMRDSRGALYAEDEEVKLLELPYKSREVSMLVVLPKQRDGLAVLEALLTPARLRAWLAAPRGESVHIKLPRFEARVSWTLDEPLKALGLVSAFTPRADFGGMVEGEPIMIDSVIQQAMVKVDEEGTVAAAVTAAGGTRSHRNVEWKEFDADRPFLFMIVDKQSGAVLFIGRVADPA